MPAVTALALLLLSPVLAAPALDPLTGLPAGLTPAALEDSAPWEQRARVLIDGPKTCVQLQGRVEVAASLFTPGGWLGRGERRDLRTGGSFDGTLDHGTWTSLTTTWEAAEGEDAIKLDRPHPIVGRLPPPPEDGEGGSISISAGGESTQVAVASGSEEALGLLDQVIADIDPAVTTAYVTWEADAGAVVLHQLVPLDGREGDLEVEVAFPMGGAPTRLDAVFPRRVRVGEGLITGTVLDAQLHLRGQETALGLLPGEEGVSLVLGVLGFTVGWEQRISYQRARPCPAPSPSPTAAPPAPEAP